MNTRITASMIALAILSLGASLAPFHAAQAEKPSRVEARQDGEESRKAPQDRGRQARPVKNGAAPAAVPRPARNTAAPAAVPRPVKNGAPPAAVPRPARNTAAPAATESRPAPVRQVDRVTREVRRASAPQGTSQGPKPQSRRDAWSSNRRDDRDGGTRDDREVRRHDDRDGGPHGDRARDDRDVRRHDRSPSNYLPSRTHYGGSSHRYDGSRYRYAYARHDGYRPRAHHHYPARRYYYPPRGYVAPVLPSSVVVVRHRHYNYWYGGGVWYRPYGTRYVVVAPPIGVFVSVLPSFYSTLWFAGVPYYYANDAYYLWRESQRAYEVVAPPPGAGTTGTDPVADDIFVYPREGQGEEQLAFDRYECHRWASDETGFDPTQPWGGVAEDRAGVLREAYLRAMTACLEGRGYTVR